VVGPGFALSGTAFGSLALLTPRLWHLYAVFATLGVATAATSALAYTRAVSSWFDRRRGLALAVVIAGGGVGGIVHAPAAEALIRIAGWRRAYLTLGALLVVVGVPTVVGLIRERSAERAGAEARPAGVPVATALRSSTFWALVLVVFGVTLAGNGAIVHLSALLTDRGVPPGRAALAVSAMGGASLAGRLLTGWLLDHYRAARVAFTLVALAALGTFVLSGARSFGMGLLAAALVGFGIGGELDVVPYMLTRYFGLRAVSTLYGFTWTALGCAGAVGPVLLGSAFDATGSYEAVLLPFAAAMLAVAAPLLALPPYDSGKAATQPV
jgi:predicted MFS family arabinose efflux permease